MENKRFMRIGCSTLTIGAIVIVILLALLLTGCSSANMDSPVRVEESDVEYIYVDSKVFKVDLPLGGVYLYRVIDEEAGVVCYSTMGNDGGVFCLLLEDTNLGTWEGN